ncbi:YgfZ/GcvT domain-containing protein [Gemmatimonas sp. UBA7669]|uniref:CAF17-like 4Fe-4S cluster assembly/insertion protein YgfZ n=1 Tax=Gemmatimonas sp. UBA7669 TaxID=1946568 RepID=UPI0025BCE9DF|nr:glycine cleavage T C-terminal barrel domain-containing protein [Gemmatimonas sp. UBA7669]
MPIDSTDLLYPAPLGADDVEAYHDLRRRAVWFEAQNHWSTIAGPKAAEALNGLVTNDVAALEVGRGLHAVALTPKGKVVCDMYVARLDDETFLCTVIRDCAEAWLSMARKYINPRLAKVHDDHESWATWLVYGQMAADAVARLGSENSARSEPDAPGGALQERIAKLDAWPVWGHAPWSVDGITVRLIRAPVMGALPGFVVLARAEDRETLSRFVQASSYRRGSRAVWNVARIEGGRPAYGVDMDENTIPQEANLDMLGAISFTKGCYTGQETVARVHFRGHVNRHLRGLTAQEVLPQHARVLDGTGKDVGDVRSTVVSPRLGAIAMAMIRREVAPGDTVQVTGSNGSISATVVALPFDEATTEAAG